MAVSKKVLCAMKPFTLNDPGEVAVPGNLGSLGFSFMVYITYHLLEYPSLRIPVVAANVEGSIKL